MKSLFIIRRTEEWANGGINPWGYDMQALWNATFNISFLGYRNFMNSLHLETVKNISFTHRIEEFDLDLGRQLLIPGRHVIPSDDDDWFHPDLLEILADNISPDKAAHRWRYAVVEKSAKLVYGNHNWQERSPWRYNTNNFCLRTPWCYLSTDHCFVDSMISPIDEKYIDETLSVHTRHLGSQSLWWHHNIHCKEQLIELREQFQHPTEDVFPEVFNQYVDRLYDFYQNRLKVTTRRRWF